MKGDIIRRKKTQKKINNIILNQTYKLKTKNTEYAALCSPISAQQQAKKNKKKYNITLKF